MSDTMFKQELTDECFRSHVAIDGLKHKIGLEEGTNYSSFLPPAKHETSLSAAAIAVRPDNFEPANSFLAPQAMTETDSFVRLAIVDELRVASASSQPSMFAAKMTVSTDRTPSAGADLHVLKVDVFDGAKWTDRTLNSTFSLIDQGGNIQAIPMSVTRVNDFSAKITYNADPAFGHLTLVTKRGAITNSIGELSYQNNSVVNDTPTKIKDPVFNIPTEVRPGHSFSMDVAETIEQYFKDDDGDRLSVVFSNLPAGIYQSSAGYLYTYGQDIKDKLGTTTKLQFRVSDGHGGTYPGTLTINKPSNFTTGDTAPLIPNPMPTTLPFNIRLPVDAGADIVLSGNIAGKWTYAIDTVLTDRVHAGFDINFGAGLRDDVGKPVYSIADGTVVKILGSAGVGIGQNILIDHGGGFYSRYLHVDAKGVSVNSTVKMGDTIASISDITAKSPHLHFELFHLAGKTGFVSDYASSDAVGKGDSTYPDAATMQKDGYFFVNGTDGKPKIDDVIAKLETIVANQPTVNSVGFATGKSILVAGANMWLDASRASIDDLRLAFDQSGRQVVSLKASGDEVVFDQSKGHKLTGLKLTDGISLGVGHINQCWWGEGDGVVVSCKLPGAGFLEGRDGRQSLLGGSQNDVLSAGNGEDTLDGGEGDDLLISGGDSDYIFADKTSGNDTLRDTSGLYDTLVLKPGVTFDDLNLNAINGDMVFRLGENASVTVKSISDGANRVDFLRMPDGSQFRIQDIVASQFGTSQADVIFASAGPGSYLNSGNGNDVIVGSAYGDLVVSGDGDDKITAGTGSDAIFGGNGNDTLNFGFGASADGHLDLVYGGSGHDVLQIHGVAQGCVVYVNGIVRNLPGVSELTGIGEGDILEVYMKGVIQIRAELHEIDKIRFLQSEEITPQKLQLAAQSKVALPTENFVDPLSDVLSLSNNAHEIDLKVQSAVPDNTGLTHLDQTKATPTPPFENSLTTQNGDELDVFGPTILNWMDS